MTNDKDIQKDDDFKGDGKSKFPENFGMLIPMQAFHVPEMVEDPRGAPIYRGCGIAPGDWCACTGRCREVVGWSQDPAKLAIHREEIKKYNDNRHKVIDYGKLDKNNDGSYTWEFKPKDNE